MVYSEDQKFTKSGLEEIIKSIIGSEISNTAPLISIKNFKLLRSWANKYGIRDNIIFEDIPQEIVEKCLSSDMDVFIPNLISLKIFENIGMQFPTDPQIFLKAGEDAPKINKMKFSLMPYVTGRKITDIATILGGINAEFNRTKFFTIDTIPFSENPALKKTIVKVNHLPGLIINERVVNWNIGLYTTMLKTTTDKIYSTHTSFDKNTGTFEFEVIYEPKPLKLVDRLFFNLTSKFENKQRKKLENMQKFMRSEIDLINANINSELKNAISRVSALETKHPASAYHSYRVATYAMIFGKQLGLNPKELAKLSIGAPMHDDGKIAIPESILHKEGKFTQDEYLIMKTHAVFGKYYLLELGYSEDIAKLTTEHQERADGSGYPFGIDYTKTTTLGLIMQICDIYDALQEKRSYKQAWTKTQIETEFNKLHEEKRLYLPFVDFFLKYTFPLINELELRNERFNFSESLFEKKEQNQLILDFIGYFKGQNNLFNINITKSPSLEKFIESHYIETITLKEKLINIGNYLLTTYGQLEGIEHRKHLKRLIPIRYHTQLFKDQLDGEYKTLVSDKLIIS